MRSRRPAPTLPARLAAFTVRHRAEVAMDDRFLIITGMAAVGLLGLYLVWTGRKGVPGGVRKQVRRGTGHAMLGLQEFVEPSVEYVFQAQNLEQKEEEDDEGL